jgi:hypothetical protein
MNTSNPRRRCISSQQLTRVNIIIARQWEETISIVQKRAEQHQQLILVHRAQQQLQRQAA